MEVVARNKWANLRDTWDIKDWAPLLIELGCDELAFKSLVLLAQQGPPGRAEANRLIWNFLKPGKVGGKYRDPAQVWQASIKHARESFDRPPVNHQDWQSWTPHKELAGEWVLKEQYGALDINGVPTTYEEARKRAALASSARDLALYDEEGPGLYCDTKATSDPGRWKGSGASSASGSSCTWEGGWSEPSWYANATGWSWGSWKGGWSKGCWDKGKTWPGLGKKGGGKNYWLEEPW